ncbi:MAG TPA: MMPL family transporter [Mycobacteriales bacterium]|nr:MMPL family transporter [Mycobacteriales bacterium]
MRTLARWCCTHRRFVLGGWLVLLLLLTGLSKAVGTHYSDEFGIPGTDSKTALELLKQATPAGAGDTEFVVVAAGNGLTLSDPRVQQIQDAALADVKALPHVTEVIPPSPLTTSKDGTIGIATIRLDVTPQKLAKKGGTLFTKTLRAHNNKAIAHLEANGQLAQYSVNSGTGPSTFIGLAAAAIILFFAFGSLVAMLLPLMTAIIALVSAVGVIALLTHVLPTPEFAGQLVLLVGLGVGVDYALFIVTRHRHALMAGHTVEESVEIAVNTSGRAVLFAGVTVCIAMLGMFALGISFFYGLAVATSLGVLFTMLASLTLLPAFLGFFGHHVLKRRHSAALRAGATEVDEDETAGWRRWALWMQRHPVVPTVVAGLLTLVIAAPSLGMKLGTSDTGNDKKGNTTRTAFDLLAKGFGPGFNGPYQLTAEVKTPADKAAFDRVVAAVAHTPGIVSVLPPQTLTGPTGRTVEIAQAYPSTAPEDEATATLLHKVRSTVIPPVAGPDLHVYITGDTALFDDFAHVIKSKLPIFIGAVVLMSFLLLMLVFRSVVIPVKAAVMNLLSVAAAFGVMTAVFQWGWGASLLGVDRNGPVDAFLPGLLFPILFGLSMDYEVFLVSRIHEEWVHSGDNRKAVTHGLAATGRTITAAAAIMILVFVAFILGPNRSVKEAGLGLASAVFFDALVIRSVLVPAIMQLLGRWNWYLPRWLDRALPVVHVEAPEAHSTEAAPEPALV